MLKSDFDTYRLWLRISTESERYAANAKHPADAKHWRKQAAKALATAQRYRP